MTASGPAFRSSPGEVRRVGRAPDPWAWTDWRYAELGRFTGRWDSPDGSYRTVYAGESLSACLVEVLAAFRPDPHLVAAFGAIEEDEADAALHPTIPPGQLDESWFTVRRAARADLDGTYCDVTHSRTIASLRPRFLAAARHHGLADLDAAALQDARPRALTQAIGKALFETHGPDGTACDGVSFPSRRGRELELWAVFERASDGAPSGKLSRIAVLPLEPGRPEVRRAAELHRIRLAAAAAPAAPPRRAGAWRSAA